MFCNKCGTEIQDDAQFCSKCGAKIQDDVRLCPKCGTEIQNDAQFCPKCGAQINSINPNENDNSSKNPIGYQNYGDVKRKSKLPVIIGVAVIAVVILGNLFSNDSKTPEKCVKKRLNVLHDFKESELKEELGEEFLDDFSIEDSSDDEVDIIGVVRKNCKNVSYDILSVDEKDDSATVKVKLIYKDCSKVFDIYYEELKQNRDKKSDLSLFFSCYDQIDIGKSNDVEEIVSLELNKVDKKWSIDDNCAGMGETAAVYFYGMTREQFETGMINTAFLSLLSSSSDNNSSRNPKEESKPAEKEKDTTAPSVDEPDVSNNEDTDKIEFDGFSLTSSDLFNDNDFEHGADSLGEGYVITEYANVEGTESIVIPNIVNGKPVVGIAKNAFASTAKLSGITAVSLPDTLKVIGDEAFASQKLEKVELPDSVISIGYGAFHYNDIKEVTLNEGLEYIGEYAFSGQEIRSIVIPSTVKLIGKGAFMGKNLNSIVFKEGKQNATIENNAFDLQLIFPKTFDIVIPGNYVYIGQGNFTNAHIIDYKASPSGEEQVYNAISDIAEFHGGPTITEIKGKFSPKTKIYGPKDSYLEQYAKENGYEFIEE